MANKHITLLVETSTTWGWEIVQGVADYSQAHTNWLLHVEPRGKYERLELPEDWQGDGVIARVTHEGLAEQILKSGVPAVNVSWYNYGQGAIPRCTSNERLAGELVAHHYLERGFRQFAYCGSKKRPNYIDLLQDAFQAIITEAGYECIAFGARERKPPTPFSKEILNSLAEWVEQLPKPIALLAFSDVRAKQVADACRLANVDVPGQVAILGGEHDLLSCHISTPKLSSIDLSPHTIGVRAAELLDCFLEGKPTPPDPVLIPPARIIVRQSTDTLAVEDPILIKALHYIQSNISEPITVKHVIANVPSSRRVLEQRFRDVLHRSPGEEIRRVRVEKAKRLLLESDRTLKHIASACGFMHAEVLTRVFKRSEGITPTLYRERFK